MCLLNVIVGSSIEKGQDKGKEEAGVSGSVESRFAWLSLTAFNIACGNLLFAGESWEVEI